MAIRQRDELRPDRPGHLRSGLRGQVRRRAREGKTYQGLTLYEAPYVPDAIQFYKIKGVSTTSTQGYDFNRELRRVGYGYTVNRKTLLFD